MSLDGASQRSRFLVLTKRSAASGDENSIGSKGCDISFFLAKFRFPAREYMRRFNAVENIYIHKVYTNNMLNVVGK